jgi:hypothetical protein
MSVLVSSFHVARDKISLCNPRPIRGFRSAPGVGKLFGSPVLASSLLLIASNVFMTFAWYAHLKNLSRKYGFIAANFIFKSSHTPSCSTKGKKSRVWRSHLLLDKCIRPRTFALPG